MKCLFIGICQLNAMCTILKNTPTFKTFYTEILNYTVFDITEEEMKNILDNILPTCDLILSQPVSNNYRGTNLFSTSTLRSKIKEHQKHLIISNCYFTGYDPVPFQTTDINGNILHVDDISYFPSISVNSLLEGNIKQACVDWCDINSYNEKELKKNIETTLNELKKREEKVFENDFGVDIKIADYIENNYKNKLLFHTYNHPTNDLLYELVRRLLNVINIPYVSNNEVQNVEYLGIYSLPPPPSVYIKMGMTFNYPKFVIRSKKYETKEAMTFFSEVLRKTDKSLHNKWLAGIKYGKVKLV